MPVYLAEGDKLHVGGTGEYTVVEHIEGNVYDVEAAADGRLRRVYVEVSISDGTMLVHWVDEPVAPLPGRWVEHNEVMSRFVVQIPATTYTDRITVLCPLHLNAGTNYVRLRSLVSIDQAYYEVVGESDRQFTLRKLSAVEMTYRLPKPLVASVTSAVEARSRYDREPPV